MLFIDALCQTKAKTECAATQLFIYLAKMESQSLKFSILLTVLYSIDINPTAHTVLFLINTASELTDRLQ